MSRRRRADDDADARDAKRVAATPAGAVALHMTRAQLACARAGCVVCRRAVFATAGVANAPNARPEACARAGTAASEGSESDCTTRGARAR